MTLDLGTALAILVPVLGLAATWGSLGTRVRQLEKELAKLDPLGKQIYDVDAKVELVRKDQGQRLGAVEADTAVLNGKFEGFERGFGAGRRSRTAAHGTPIKEPKGGGE